MKKNYYIIGAGGFAKEVFMLTLECGYEKNAFKGFIETKSDSPFVNIGNQDYPIILEEDFLNTRQHDVQIELFMGIGNPKIIEKLTKKFQSFHFPNLVHPSVQINESVKLNAGNIVTCGCIFTVDITIGSFNIFNLNSTIGHDTVIGNFNVINPGVNISGGVTIGNANLLGTNSTVLQYVNIGDNSILGAGSLANKHLSSNLTYVGIPAKPINK